MFSINTGKNVTNMPPSRYEVESKYRKILELSSKLGTLCNQAKSLQQLYSSNALNLRHRLCDEIKVIFRYAPIEYGHRCEEILWKRNYYDYVKFCKKFRKDMSSNDLDIFRMHITSGIGHYQSLFFSFCKAFKLTNLEEFLSYLPFQPNFIVKENIHYNLTGLNNGKCAKSAFENESNVDEYNYIGDIDNDEDGLTIELDLEYVQDEKYLPSLNYLAHRFCICLGDLARYYIDFFPNPENSKSFTENRFSHYYFNVAAFYYKTASIIEPALGMPFNQLGTLYTGGHYGLDSLFYYIRCLNSKETFTGVKENMRTTFETAQKMLLKCQSSNAKGKLFNNQKQKQASENVQPSNQLIKEAILNVIKLFWEVFNVGCEAGNIGNRPLSVGKLLNMTNETLVKISLALEAEPSPNSSRTSPGSLTDECIFQIISLFAMQIELIKSPNQEGPLEVKFASVSHLNAEDVITDGPLKVNFLHFIAYRFLFQFFNLLIKHEILRKWLGTIPAYAATSNNNNNSHKSKDFSGGVGQQLKNGKPKLKKPVLATSFSSEFNDNTEDSAMLNQLKSTALKSIVSLFDQSDNEEEECDDETGGDGVANGAGQLNGAGDDSDSESVSDLIEKLIFSDDENDLDDTSLIDQALNRNAAPRPTGTKAVNTDKPSSNNNVNSSSSVVVPMVNQVDAKTMDQLLDEVQKCLQRNCLCFLSRSPQAHI